MPTIIRWPGHVPAGHISNSVLDQIDILPTFVKAAGGTVDPSWKVDGNDELAAWEGKANPDDRTIFLEYRNDGWFNLAAISGDWKLVLENKAQFASLETLPPLDSEKVRANEALLGDAIAGRRSMDSLPPDVTKTSAATLGTTDGPRLYNVAKDPSERRNYYFSRPEISLKLRSDLLAWLSTETELSKHAPRTLAPPPPNTPD